MEENLRLRAEDLSHVLRRGTGRYVTDGAQRNDDDDDDADDDDTGDYQDYDNFDIRARLFKSRLKLTRG